MVYLLNFQSSLFPRDLLLEPACWRHCNRQPCRPPAAQCSLAPQANDGAPFDLPAVVSEYTLTRVIGRPSATRAVLYEATHNDDDHGQLYLIKALSIHALPSWDALDKLNYEASLIKDNKIDHPNIPTFIDFFQHQTPADCIYCLVLSACTSCSLQPLHAFMPTYCRGQRDVYLLAMSLLTSLLNALDYLYSLRPHPVSHNCIIPSNIYICPANEANEFVPFLLNFAPAPPNESEAKRLRHSIMCHQNDLYAVALLILSVITGDDSLSDQFAYAHDMDNDTINEFVSYLLSTSFISNQDQDVFDPCLYESLSRMLHPIKSHRFSSARQILSFLSSSPTQSQQLTLFEPIQKATTTLDNLYSERDDIAGTLSLHRAPAGTTWSTITSTAFALGWSALSLSLTFSPAATVISRIITSGFALAGYPIAKSAWTQRDFESRLFFTFCSINQHVLVHRVDSIKSNRVYSADLIFSSWLRASITMLSSNSSRDEQTTPALLLSDGIQIHVMSSLGLSYRQIEWLTLQINEYIQLLSIR